MNQTDEEQAVFENSKWLQGLKIHSIPDLQ